VDFMWGGMGEATKFHLVIRDGVPSFEKGWLGYS
jgi:hypothetical protein